jgi:hypothetical protein
MLINETDVSIDVPTTERHYFRIGHTICLLRSKYYYSSPEEGIDGA